MTVLSGGCAKKITEKVDVAINRYFGLDGYGQRTTEVRKAIWKELKYETAVFLDQNLTSNQKKLLHDVWGRKADLVQIDKFLSTIPHLWPRLEKRLLTRLDIITLSIYKRCGLYE
jgi:hypothetical protein